MSFKGKKMTVFAVKDKFCAFKQKFESWKNCVHRHEFDSFQYLEIFPDRNNGVLINVISDY